MRGCANVSVSLHWSGSLLSQPSFSLPAHRIYCCAISSAPFRYIGCMTEGGAQAKWEPALPKVCFRCSPRCQTSAFGSVVLVLFSGVFPVLSWYFLCVFSAFGAVEARTASLPLVWGMPRWRCWRPEWGRRRHGHHRPAAFSSSHRVSSTPRREQVGARARGARR